MWSWQVLCYSTIGVAAGETCVIRAIRLKMCKCKKYPKFFESDTYDPYFKDFEKISIKQNKFVILVRCPQCKQHWQLDAGDNYRSGLAIKIDVPEKWDTYDDIDVRIAFLIKSRGGLSDETCLWSGCNNKALNGLAYCPKCAYEKSNINK